MIGVIIAVLLCFMFLAVPMVLIQNKKHLAEMEKIIDEFHEKSAAFKDPLSIKAARQRTMKKLIALKSKITVSKEQIEKARDLISSL